MADDFENLFKLRRPCSNCPFLKKGGINLAPGRFEGIVEMLVSDDWSHFHCHKTVHSERTGGEWDDDGNYEASGQESMCAGAMIYLEKAGRPTVGMRLGRAVGMYSPSELEPNFDLVIDPDKSDER